MSTPDFPITIYHNPGCGTSRNVVAAVEQAGYAPTVVRYLDAGWTPEVLRALAKDAQVPLRDLLRDKGTPAAELGLLADGVSDDVLLKAMVDHPILVNRPIVRTPKGVQLCRPSEKVFDLLEAKPASFTKEDGEVLRP